MHKHECCKHECLHYCSYCQKVYCCKCGMEWGDSWYPYYQQPYYNPCGTITWTVDTYTQPHYGAVIVPDTTVGDSTYNACAHKH